MAKKLDFGCGPHPREGFEGVDAIVFAGVKYLCDLTVTPWVLTEIAVPEDPHIAETSLVHGVLADGKAWYAVPGAEPLPDGSVEEAHASHFIEHLTGPQRIAFVNELYRVLEPGGKCSIIVPHWASMRAYGDLSHQWPPVSEFWFFYLNAEWRAVNAPHLDAQFNSNGYRCNFEATWGYTMRPDLNVRNVEYQQFAIANYKEAALDTVATLVKR